MPLPELDVAALRDYCQSAKISVLIDEIERDPRNAFWG